MIIFAPSDKPTPTTFIIAMGLTVYLKNLYVDALAPLTHNMAEFEVRPLKRGDGGDEVSMGVHKWVLMQSDRFHLRRKRTEQRYLPRESI